MITLNDLQKSVKRGETITQCAKRYCTTTEALHQLMSQSKDVSRCNRISDGFAANDERQRETGSSVKAEGRELRDAEKKLAKLESEVCNLEKDRKGISANYRKLIEDLTVAKAKNEEIMASLKKNTEQMASMISKISEIQQRRKEMKSVISERRTEIKELQHRIEQLETVKIYVGKAVPNAHCCMLEPVWPLAKSISELLPVLKDWTFEQVMELNSVINCINEVNELTDCKKLLIFVPQDKLKLKKCLEVLGYKVEFGD